MLRIYFSVSFPIMTNQKNPGSSKLKKNSSVFHEFKNDNALVYSRSSVMIVGVATKNYKNKNKKE